MKKISIVTSCYNEQGNIIEFYERVTKVMESCPQYTHEILCIDNCSIDATRDEIRAICSKDKRVKAIFNVRNFGPVRSGAYMFYKAKGHAVISMASDLEDPPELIPEFIRMWEKGSKVVLAVRTKSAERGILPLFRKAYYSLIQIISNVKQIPGATGFGLYDQCVVETLRTMHDPYPYMRGLICEMGWPIEQVLFEKPVRPRGVSSYNILRYFDEGMLGIVNSSKLPLRLATYMGGAVSCISFCLGLYYMAQKLLNWDAFQAGLTPLMVSLFFLMGLLFLFLGLVGEYVGLILTHVVHRPMVVEAERINFVAPDD